VIPVVELPDVVFYEASKLISFPLGSVPSVPVVVFYPF